MRGEVDGERRRLLAAAAAAASAAGFGLGGGIARAMSAPGSTSVRTINAGVLEVAYLEAGLPRGTPVILLHGWPYDVHAFEEVVPSLSSRGYRVIVPYLRGFGPTRFLSPDTVRNGQPGALAMDAIALMDALKIDRAVLGGFDWGARTADILAALWPERVKGLVAVSGYLVGSQAAGKQPLLPEAEYQWWYQFYLSTPRGALGYAKYTREFAELIWKLASPKWTFGEATFARSALALNNPDHVPITLHNYRWRQGLVEGEPKYDAIEQKLAAGPTIPVPTITMEGDANGAPHPPPGSYRAKFTGPYEHRTVSGGIGHNLPQEAPRKFTEALIDVASW